MTQPCEATLPIRRRHQAKGQPHQAKGQEDGEAQFGEVEEGGDKNGAGTSVLMGEKDPGEQGEEECCIVLVVFFLGGGCTFGVRPSASLED